MDEGIGKTVMLFLLWLGLFFAPPIMGAIAGRLFTSHADYETGLFSSSASFCSLIAFGGLENLEQVTTLNTLSHANA